MSKKLKRTPSKQGNYFCMGIIILLLSSLLGIFIFQIKNIKKLLKKKETRNAALLKEVQKVNMANEATRNFLSLTSHDIRTPINGIMGMTEIAVKNLNNTDKVLGCLKKINDSSNHLLSLINNILDMEKIESGKITLKQNPFDIEELIHNCITIVGGQSIQKNITIIKKTGYLPHPRLMGDELHLRQILINILGNAVKFTPEHGTVTLKVYEESCSGRKALLRFEIEDTGIGIRKEFLEKIFEPFAQDVHNQEGTGLGMAITKQFVDLMGGTIQIKSKLGKGSLFTVTIPFEITHAAIEKAEKISEPDLSGMKILLVEDNDLNLEITQELLTERGIFVTTAKNGKEAADIFIRSKEGEIDLILMDIIMPIMDGLEAARSIRSSNHPMASKIPIIAMTGNAFAEDAEKSKKAGMNAHLIKPIETEKLIETLAQFWFA